MRRWMDDQDTFYGTQPGYWYDDGQPEPAYEYGSSMVDDTGMYKNPTLAQLQASYPVSQKIPLPDADVLAQLQTLYSVPQEIPQPDADAFAQLRASYPVPQEMPQADADALAQLQAPYPVPQEMPQAEPPTGGPVGLIAPAYGSSPDKNPVQVSADARVSDAGRDQRMGAYDYLQAGYSPETVKYLDDLVAQRQALSDKYGEGIALNNPDYMYSRYAQDAGGADESYKVYTPEEDIRRIMASGQDASEIFDPGYNVQSWGGSRNPNQFDFVRLGAGKTYTYTDNNTGETYTASTPEQVQALTQLAKSQSGAGNNSASWSIKDSSGKEVASDTSYTPSLLKQTGQTISDLLVEYGPSILAIPMTGGMSLGALMATAGGTAALGKLLKTGDLQKSIITGLVSGATAGALKVSGASDFIGNKLGEYGISMPTGASTAPSFAGPSSAAFSGVDLSSTLPGFAAGTSFGGAIAPPSGASEAIQVGLTKGATVPVASGVGSLVGNVAGNALPQGPGTYTDAQGVERGTVTGTKPINTGIAPVVAPAIAPAVTKGVEAVTVTDTKPTNTGVDVAPVVAPAIAPLVTNTGSYTNKAGVEEVNPTAKKIEPSTITPTIPALAPFQPPSASVASLEPPKIPPAEKSTVGKVLPYVGPALTIAGLIANTVGSTKGTKPPGTGPTGTYVPDPLPKIFTDPLPGVVKPTELPKPYGATDPGAGGRNLTDEDWYSYGFGPEKSFFKDVPGTPIGVREPAPKLPVVPDPNLAVIPKPKLPVVPDPKLAVTPNPKLPVVPDPKLAVTPSKGLVKPETLLEARLKEMGTWVNDKTGNKYLAKGGSTNRFAVRGPGDGRSDDIPANLSDGEYVIDAETVALLGDGSSKAGADKLDRFRVNVRKHKGKSLAAGRFSVAAKQPEAYLKGRT